MRAAVDGRPCLHSHDRPSSVHHSSVLPVRAFLFSVDLFSTARSLIPQLYVFSLELSVQAVAPGVAIKGAYIFILEGSEPSAALPVRSL